MIIKRLFEEETSLSTLKSAANGLTPFAVPCMSESEVEEQNEQAAALAKASSTTVKDHTQLRIKAKSPGNFGDMLKQIKCYGNLLFALFGYRCPLLCEVQDLIEDLDDYSENARKNTSRKTTATIMWILHLQSRHFAAGHMEGNRALLASYRYMSNSVRTIQPVVNGDVPEELYTNNNRNNNKHNSNLGTGSGNAYRYRNPTQDERDPRYWFDDSYDRDLDYDRANYYNTRFNKYLTNQTYAPGDIRRYIPQPSENPYKRQKVEIVELKNYHPHLKAAMKALRGQGRVPRVQEICNACNIKAEELFPNKPTICIKATLFGTCFANCIRSHDSITDDEAKSAIDKLKPILNDPSILQVNKNKKF